MNIGKVIRMSTTENRICKRRYRSIQSIFGGISDNQIYNLFINVNSEEDLSLRFKWLAIEKDISLISEDFDGLTRKIYPLRGKIRKFLFIKQQSRMKNFSSRGNTFHHKPNKKRFIPYTVGYSN